MSCPTVSHSHVPHGLLILPHQAILQLSLPLAEIVQVPLGFPDLVIEALMDGDVVRGLSHRASSIDETFLPLDLALDIFD